ncbi:MAG: translation initiation factor IF-2 [Candidatus Aureabacteria bacterium]|nr:translation initiation factor IF-2 [Candidatus Auribacterota bacterium]
MRVNELAKSLNLVNKDLLALLSEMGIAVKSHSSSITEEQAAAVRARHPTPASAPSAPPPPPKTPPAEKPAAAARPKKTLPEAPLPEPPPAPAVPLQSLMIKFPVTVREFSGRLNQKPNIILKKLMDMGLFCSLNQFLDEGPAQIISREYGFEIKAPVRGPSETPLSARKEAAHPRPAPVKEEHAEPRAPVVTLMGHIDHGKTSLLDGIRRTRVAAGEAGGITQHIGAYRVKTKQGSIVFLDTPGHKAFTTMRARGAQLTDIVVLVVAADDGIMPQTLEAIDHAQAANVPILVAINKTDKSTASPDKVKRQLAERGLLPEEMGGKTICVPVSAKTKEGLEHLLEMIQLQAEIMELKALPTGPAEAVVVEARHTADRGPVVTLLVKKGTLRKGDAVVCDIFPGKVKGMFDDTGFELQEAGPSTPVEVLGIMGVPSAGALCTVVGSDAAAREIADGLQAEKKAGSQETVRRASLEDLFQKLSQGTAKELNLIVKADVQGTLEALLRSLQELSTPRAGVKFIHSGVGAISESDVMLASASGAVIVGFGVKAESRIKQFAGAEGVDVREYAIIYEAVDEVTKALVGLLEPKIEEQTLGQARIKQVFKITKVGIVAGCEVEKGKVARGNRVKILREGQVIGRDTVTLIKRFKDTVDEVGPGMECGISLGNFRDYNEGDIIEAYRIKETAQTI